MTTDGSAPRTRQDVVAAAEVDPVLWGMSAELLQLRRQLGELRQTLEEREGQLVEARQGAQGSDRAATTLKGVLTEMILKGRADLQAARDEAKRSIAERVAAARSEADLLVAEATAALTTALARQAESAAARPPPSAARSQLPDPSVPPPPPAASPPAPPEPSSPEPFPAQTPPPASPFMGEAESWSSGEPRSRAATNGRNGVVQTLDYDLHERFEQVVGLLPNADFRTPPRGTPAVPATHSIGPPSAPLAPTAAAPAAPQATAEAYSDFWRSGPLPTGAPEPVVPGDGRPPIRILDALLPLIAVALVLIVVLLWFG